jgi:micrococcal nuclease
MGFAAVAKSLQMRPVFVITLSLAVLAAATISAPPVSAEQATIVPSCAGAGLVPARFVSALTASSFRADNGKEIRLAGVIGPGEDGRGATPGQVAAARAALGSLLSRRSILLAIVGSPDRYGRITAEVFADGLWVQDATLRGGLLRVAPDRLVGSCIRSMVAAEDDAISGKAGHWSDGLYSVRTPDQVTRSAGRFETVEGEVWRTRLVKGRETIEFANASSFQLNVLPRAARDLRNIGIDIRRLRGRRVRVRGWVGFDDTPTLEVSTPEGLEVIGKVRRRR